MKKTVTEKQIIRHYNRRDEDGRLFPQHGQVEYRTTMRYIHRYLSPGMRVLEVGAGTGRYSHALAKEGFTVDAVELVPKHIRAFKRKITPDETISIRRGNVLDLSAIPDGSYDVILVLGPLYHLYNEDDKRRAIAEVLRVTKPGGVVFAAYCVGDNTIYQYGFIKGNIWELLEKGMLDTETFHPKSTPKEFIELVRKEDIDRLMMPFAVERLHYVATDLYTCFIKDTVDAMDEKTFALYMQYHFFLCERPDVIGMTNHSLDVFRKCE